MSDKKISHSKRGFVHLHVHTEYSLLDGLTRIKDLVMKTVDFGMNSVAVTDHGVLYGAIEFYKKAKEFGIKPIIGMEAYITEDIKIKGPYYHLLILAKNNTGYKNLMRLASIGHIEGFYYRPRIDKKILEKYKDGLIITSACMQGEIPSYIKEGEFEKALKSLQWYLDVFGDDFYLEIQRHNFSNFIDLTKDSDIKNSIRQSAEDEKKVNEGIIKLSRQLGVPLVATNDVHYLKKEDALAQDVLVCIATGKTLDDKKRLRYIDTPDFYFKSPEEMREIFADLSEACDNTLKIASKCDLEIEIGRWYFPHFPLPDGKTAEEYLRDLCNERVKERVGNVTKEVQERLNYELDVISQKGYAPYFLIVADMVNWANSKGIITNTRGSAAGSLVSYVLGITTVNPLTYMLPFERFLNPYRPSPPDIDFDVADNRRGEVINYIIEKYGREKVAQICTFGRMLSRAAIRDVARVLGYPYSVGDRIAKLIPFPKQGFPVSIPKALEEVPELSDLYKKDKDTKKIIDLAIQIEGNARHISVHAAGLVVSPTYIWDFAPIQKEPSGENIITQYEMHACEDVGLIKFDILGIRNLSILGAAVDILKRSGVEVDLKRIPLDDKKTFEMLSRGETMGVFQLSSAGMTKYLKELRPTRVEDLMAMVALYRPGPIAVIPEYIRRKRNPKLVKVIDKRVEKYLRASYDLIVYQDDLLFCAIELAGYTWEEADKFRKAVGKKIPEEMAAQKEKFIQGVIKNGRDKKFAEELWKLFEPFQSYGFNKAHAASYGMVAYMTAYMKANYPVEYMTALLTAESGDKDKVSAAINECRRMKIKVLPPNVNESESGFSIVEDKESLNRKAIRFGLDAIKNVGQAAISAILEERSKNGKFTNIYDFLSRIDNRKVNKKVLESLIKAGALSDFGTRSYLLKNLDDIRSKISKRNTEKERQPTLFSDNLKSSLKVGDLDKNLTESVIEEMVQEEIEAFEKELLGFSLSSRPLSDILQGLDNLATHKISEILDENIEVTDVVLAGVIKEVKVIITKKNLQEMAFVRLEDLTGTIELVIFPKIYGLIKDNLKEGKPLVVSGRVSYRDNAASVLVNSIISSNEIDYSQSEVLIDVPSNTDTESLRKLKNYLLKVPGDKSVVLFFRDKNEKIKIPFKIRWDAEVAKQISEIIEGKNYLN